MCPASRSARSTGTTASAIRPTSWSDNSSSFCRTSKRRACPARRSWTTTSSSPPAGADPVVSGCTKPSTGMGVQNAGFDGFRILLFQQNHGIKAASGEPGLKFSVDFGLGRAERAQLRRRAERHRVPDPALRSARGSDRSRVRRGDRAARGRAPESAHVSNRRPRARMAGRARPGQSSGSRA